ncbi:MAG: hypothetical protein WC437_02170 [Patescibacteria group bacterium]
MSKLPKGTIMNMKRLSVAMLVNVLFFMLVSKIIIQSLKMARRGWKANPNEMLTKIIFSGIVGQGVFWLIGYDQLGTFMNPKVRMGFGRNVAEEAYKRIPHTPTMAWIIKITEILADAGKIPIEGAVYRKHGFTPDAVAALVTQPLWSTIETTEKFTGAVMHPERVSEPDQVKNSIGCIYGSFFRYLQAGVLLFTGIWIYRIIGKPMETGLGKMITVIRQK